jgi:hypothetical protein
MVLIFQYLVLRFKKTAAAISQGRLVFTNQNPACRQAGNCYMKKLSQN